jgi:hypothetical protein
LDIYEHRALELAYEVHKIGTYLAVKIKMGGAG